MMTPACRADAGSATELLEAIGSISVTSTPMPNAAISTSNKSGLRFTVLLSPIQKRDPLRGLHQYLSVFIPSNIVNIHTFITDGPRV